MGEAYGEHITLRLARMVQDAMDAYCRDNEDFPVRPHLLAKYISLQAQLMQMCLTAKARPTPCTWGALHHGPFDGPLRAVPS